MYIIVPGTPGRLWWLVDTAYSLLETERIERKLINYKIYYKLTLQCWC